MIISHMKKSRKHKRNAPFFQFHQHFSNVVCKEFTSMSMKLWCIIWQVVESEVRLDSLCRNRKTSRKPSFLIFRSVISSRTSVCLSVRLFLRLSSFLGTTIRVSNLIQTFWESSFTPEHAACLWEIDRYTTSPPWGGNKFSITCTISGKGIAP